MDRSFLVQVVKRVLAYLIIVPMVCCAEKPSECEKVPTRVLGTAGGSQQFEDTLRRYQICSDSIRNSGIEHADMYAFAYDSLLKKRFLPDGYDLYRNK